MVDNLWLCVGRHYCTSWSPTSGCALLDSAAHDALWRPCSRVLAFSHSHPPLAMSGTKDALLVALCYYSLFFSLFHSETHGTTTTPHGYLDSQTKPFGGPLCKSFWFWDHPAPGCNKCPHQHIVSTPSHTNTRVDFHLPAVDAEIFGQ